MRHHGEEDGGGEGGSGGGGGSRSLFSGQIFLLKPVEGDRRRLVGNRRWLVGNQWRLEGSHLGIRVASDLKQKLLVKQQSSK